MNRIEVYYNKCDNQLQSSRIFNILIELHKEMHLITLTEYIFLTKNYGCIQ